MLKKVATLLICLSQFTVQAAQANKIIALSPHSVEMLFAMGAGNKIVATTNHADYPEAAQKIEQIGGFHGILIERVLEINPDLIVVWTTGNKKEQIKQLQSLGFNLYFSNPKTLDDIAVEMEQLGSLVGQQEKATQLAQQFRHRLASISEQYQNKKKVKAFYQLWSQPLRTVSDNSWVGQMISRCGGDNIFAHNASDYPQVSLENVILGRPEILVLPIDESTGVLPDDINWQLWPEIPAVKNNFIYQADADLLHRTSPRALDGLEQLCQAIDSVRQDR